MLEPESTRGRKDSLTPTLWQGSLWKSVRLPLILLISALSVWLMISMMQRLPPLSQEETMHDEFYNEELSPIIKHNERKNQLAAERAIERINEVFDNYRNGIHPFAEDITSYGTRFGILRRIPGDWWYENEQVAAFVLEKFEEHLFSEEQFYQEISEALLALREDLEANTNRLLVSAISTHEFNHISNMGLADLEYFNNEVISKILYASKDQARSSLYYGVATLALSELAAITAQQVVSKTLSSYRNKAISSTASVSGATATSTTAGSTIGAPAGPAGIAIGIGVGLVVGIIIDWWMTDRFKEKIRNDLDAYLHEMEADVMKGSHDDPGLESVIRQFVDDLSFSQAIVLRRELIGEGS